MCEYLSEEVALQSLRVKKVLHSVILVFKQCVAVFSFDILFSFTTYFSPDLVGKGGMLVLTKCVSLRRMDARRLSK